MEPRPLPSFSSAAPSSEPRALAPYLPPSDTPPCGLPETLARQTSSSQG